MSNSSRESASIINLVGLMAKRAEQAAKELKRLAETLEAGAPIGNATEAASIITNLMGNIPLERLAHLSMESGKAHRATDRVLLEARSSCECESPNKCTCPSYDEIVFKVNGKSGFGSGHLGESKAEPVRRFFSCTFMGWQFEADDIGDAAEQLKAHLAPFQHMDVEFHQ